LNVWDSPPLKGFGQGSLVSMPYSPGIA